MGIKPEPTILAEVEEATGTAFITLNRPPLNILDTATLGRLGEALEEAVGGAGASIVVLRAAGTRAFSAGTEVAEHRPEKVGALIERFHRAALYLREMEAVSIAAVKGPALGGGFELAACCDLIVAAEGASFGLPEINLGCFPPAALAALSPVIGRHGTADIVLTGRRLSAFECLAMGIVSRVVPPEEFEPALAALLADLQSKSRSVLKVAVRALRRAGPGDFRSALGRMERIFLEDLLRLEDAKEGIEAYLENRKPEWTGR